jgi:hypothetical protein
MYLAKMFQSAGFKIDELSCWGFPMAVTFRKLVSTQILRRRLHEPMSKSSLIRGVAPLLRLIDIFFRIDDISKNLHLGLGLILKARKMS